MGSQWGVVFSKWGVNGESDFEMGSQRGVVFSKWGVNGESDFLSSEKLKSTLQLILGVSILGIMAAIFFAVRRLYWHVEIVPRYSFSEKQIQQAGDKDKAIFQNLRDGLSSSLEDRDWGIAGY
jgi:hypothetical protein